MRHLSFRPLVFGLVLLLGAVLAGCGDGSDGDSKNRPAHARHIILFIGDGMQVASEIATSRYLYGEDFALAWHKFPGRGAVTTWDVNAYNVFTGYFGAPSFDEGTFDPNIGFAPEYGGSLPWPLDITGNMAYLTGAATDSASAATALATGYKTDSGNIAWLRNDPVDGQLTTIAETMRAELGAAIGVVTTVPFSHATPAAFVSHNPSRGNYYEIAEEIINVTRPEVVIGGGHPNWCGGYMTGTQLDTLRSSTDYLLVERMTGLDGGRNLLYTASVLPPDRRLFGLFGGGGGDMETPTPFDAPGHPGFMVNSENPSLADSTRAALMVLSADPDGFFLMVEAGDIDYANHGNDLSRMIGATWRLDEAVAAAVEYINLPGDDLRWDNTLVIVTADHATGGLRLNSEVPILRGDLPSSPGIQYAYATSGHTNEPVGLYARGARHNVFRDDRGQWYPHTTLIDNTQIYEGMRRAAGLE